MKKKEVLKCFTDLEMDFDEIINFRGYPLDYHQIEMYLADCINLGYSYNWKQINDGLHKVYGHDGDGGPCKSDELFFIDFIILQMKVIELLQNKQDLSMTYRGERKVNCHCRKCS